MRKQIARTVSILTLLVTLSVGPVNVWAGGGGTCSIPSCRPNQLSVQSGTQAWTQTVASEESLSFDAFLLVLRATSFLWL